LTRKEGIKMALSNWDCLGIDQDGKICSDIQGLSPGKSVEIYKNWLYVYDKDMWSVDGIFSETCIAEIKSGEIQLSDFKIVAERCDFQESIFCFIQLRYNDEEKERWFAGIGCSGYDDDTPKLFELANIDPDRYEICYHTEYDPNDDGSEEWLPHIDDKERDYPERMYILMCKDKTLPEGSDLVEFAIPFDQCRDLIAVYVGVLPETYRSFIKFLQEQEFDYEEHDVWLEKLKSGEMVPGRYNQGDKYIFDNINTPCDELETSNNQKPFEDDELTPITPVGETPSKPVIMSMLNGE